MITQGGWPLEAGSLGSRPSCATYELLCDLEQGQLVSYFGVVFFHLSYLFQKVSYLFSCSLSGPLSQQRWLLKGRDQSGLSTTVFVDHRRQGTRPVPTYIPGDLNFMHGKC